MNQRQFLVSGIYKYTCVYFSLLHTYTLSIYICMFTGKPKRVSRFMAMRQAQQNKQNKQQIPAKSTNKNNEKKTFGSYSSWADRGESPIPLSQREREREWAAEQARVSVSIRAIRVIQVIIRVIIIIIIFLIYLIVNF